MTTLFLLAGEHSGDLHGGALLRALRRRQPGWHYLGVGGPEMRSQGFEVTLPMEEFQIFGFGEILRKAPRIWRQFRATRDCILARRPDAVILIDYPGFNLRLARSLRKHGYGGKIVQFICPTVWVHGKGRIRWLEAYDDLLLTIFPFEPALFSHNTLPVRFVGHPLMEMVAQHGYRQDWREQCHIAPAERTLALFPGSRSGEVQRLLSRQLQAALLLRHADPGLQILISCADPALAPAIQREMERTGLSVGIDIGLVPKAFTGELMRDCRTALAKSGTVTLELALHGVPTVVVYETSRFNTWIARYLLRLKLDYFCIVNILCQRMVFPEWIAKPFTAEEIAVALQALHREGPERSLCLEGCRQVRDALQTPSGMPASEQAAQAIEELLEASHA